MTRIGEGKGSETLSLDTTVGVKNRFCVGVRGRYLPDGSTRWSSILVKGHRWTVTLFGVGERD